MLVEGDEHPVTNVTYTYDDGGNPVSIVDAPVSGVGDAQCFAYDGLRRLTQAWTPSGGDCSVGPSVAGLGGAAPYWFTDTFDVVGNRTSRVVHAAGGDTTTTFAYAPGTHRVAGAASSGPGGATSSSFGYDDAGNTTTRDVGGQTQSLVWDAEGELAQVTGGSSDSYVYTADGDRLVRRQGGSTTVYLPGGMELIATGGTVTATRYYSFGGRVVAVRTGPGIAGVSTLVADHHGTAGLSIENTSRVVSRRYTDPYGAPRGTAPAVWVGDHGFLDKPVDATGLVQVGARYYDPGLGRFVSVDPVMDLADPQQWHGYAYANNNPITYRDPSGLAPMIDGEWGSPQAMKAAQGGKKAAQQPTPQTVKEAIQQASAPGGSARGSRDEVGSSPGRSSKAAPDPRAKPPSAAPPSPADPIPGGLGSCGSVSGGFIVYGSISFCMISFSDFTDLSSYEPVLSGTFGWGTPGATIEGGLIETSADSLEEFTGESYTVGASVGGKGLSVGADVSWSENSQGEMVWTAYEGVGLGLYAPFPMEVHSGWTMATRAW